MNNAIPVKIKPMHQGSAPDDDGSIGGGVHALGHEIQSCLEKLAASGESSMIDLKTLPMAPGEYDDIKTMLGQGELDLVLDMDGPTRIRETAYPGVWWIQHKDRNDQILSEIIEISRVPDFLAIQADQVTESAKRLRDRLVPKEQQTTPDRQRV
ncbi:MAG: hydrogenase expression/formation C-terminal domain-containing protein [Wenzhouxiangellaceae bacterium]|nr:hydrogenase expression/formation C-terminal domain-containing protein [Wenzhouxiangellaceae bacterium]